MKPWEFKKKTVSGYKTADNAKGSTGKGEKYLKISEQWSVF